MKLSPRIRAIIPLLADHTAVMAVMEITVPLDMVYISSIIDTIRGSSVSGNISTATVNKRPFVTGVNRIRLNKRIIIGKSESIIKKDACAAKALTWSSLMRFVNLFIIV